jgi:hypothetical protein
MVDVTVDMSKPIPDRQQQGQLIIAQANITAGFATIGFMKG